VEPYADGWEAWIDQLTRNLDVQAIPWKSIRPWAMA